MKYPSCSDYTNSIRVNQLIKADKLRGGNPIYFKDNPIKYVGGFCVVFPYEVHSKKYAVRCWHAYLEDAQIRIKTLSKSLKKYDLPYFVDFEYIDEGIATAVGIMPIVIMENVELDHVKILSAKNRKAISDNFSFILFKYFLVIISS